MQGSTVREDLPCRVSERPCSPDTWPFPHVPLAHLLAHLANQMTGLLNRFPSVGGMEMNANYQNSGMLNASGRASPVRLTQAVGDFGPLYSSQGSLYGSRSVSFRDVRNVCQCVCARVIRRHIAHAHTLAHIPQVAHALTAPYMSHYSKFMYRTFPHSLFPKHTGPFYPPSHACTHILHARAGMWVC